MNFILDTSALVLCGYVKQSGSQETRIIVFIVIFRGKGEGV